MIVCASVCTKILAKAEQPLASAVSALSPNQSTRRASNLSKHVIVCAFVYTALTAASVVDDRPWLCPVPTNKSNVNELCEQLCCFARILADIAHPLASASTRHAKPRAPPIGAMWKISERCPANASKPAKIEQPLASVLSDLVRANEQAEMLILTLAVLRHVYGDEVM